MWNTVVLHSSVTATLTNSYLHTAQLCRCISSTFKATCIHLL